VEQIQITTKEVTSKFFEDFKKGQIIGFQQEDGSMRHYKLTRFSKSKKEATGTLTTLYTEEQMNAMSKEEVKEIVTGSK
jgi:hypothetical protein